MSEPWLLVIDAQRIFASPDSAWGSPMWGDVVEPVRRLAVPADDPLLDLVEPVRDLGAHVLSAPTFGKWGPDLTTLSGPTPDLVVAGVSTDCCVVSTVLTAADTGATLTVVSRVIHTGQALAERGQNVVASSSTRYAGGAVTVLSAPPAPHRDTATCLVLVDCVTGVEACRRSNAAAAVKVTRRGPTSASTATEVEELLRDRTGSEVG